MTARGGTSPTSAVDGRSGAVYVAWVGMEDSTTANVYLARSDSAAFTAPIRVNAVSGDAAPHLQAPAQVAVGPEGNVYVAWQSARRAPGLMFGAADIRLARSRDGGQTFGPAVSVNDDAGGIAARHTFHDLAVAPNGTVYVSWIDARGRDSLRVKAAATQHGGSGHEPHGNHHHGKKAASVMGRHPGEPGTDIRVAWSSDQGRSFNVGVVVDTNSCTCCRTAVAAGPGGELYVAWRKYFPGGVNDIVVARSGDGGRTWDAPVKVHDDGWVFPGCPHAGPDLLVDERSGVHVVWYTGAPGREGLYYAASTDGAQTFGNAVPLVAGGVPVSQAHVAPAGPSAVWITWEDRRTDPVTVSMARASAGGHLERYDRLTLTGTAPGVAAAGTRLALTWLDGETVRARTGT